MPAKQSPAVAGAPPSAAPPPAAQRSPVACRALGRPDKTGSGWGPRLGGKGRVWQNSARVRWQHDDASQGLDSHALRRVAAAASSIGPRTGRQPGVPEHDSLGPRGHAWARAHRWRNKHGGGGRGRDRHGRQRLRHDGGVRKVQRERAGHHLVHLGPQSADWVSWRRVPGRQRTHAGTGHVHARATRRAAVAHGAARTPARQTGAAGGTGRR